MDVNQDPHLLPFLPVGCKHLLGFQLAPPISFPIESLFTTDSPQCQGSDETRSPFCSAAHADAFSFSSCSSVFLACLSFWRGDTTGKEKKGPPNELSIFHLQSSGLHSLFTLPDHLSLPEKYRRIVIDTSPWLRLQAFLFIPPSIGGMFGF
jgi:hypothetical protein